MQKIQLHPKIKERKLTAGQVTMSSVGLSELSDEVQQRVRTSLDDRIVEGYLFIWGKRNLHGEKFMKGAFARSIRENGPDSNAKYKIKFLNQHRTDEPLALFDLLVEDDIGLFFRTKPLDEVPWADHVLTQLRSGTLNNFSGGFNFIWDTNAIKYEEESDSLIVLDAILLEGSVATIPSDMETYTVRSAEDAELLEDEIAAFIETLPRKDRLQAKQLFTRHKSLSDFIAQQTRLEEIKKRKPVEKRKVDYNYLTQNFNLK